MEFFTHIPSVQDVKQSRTADTMLFFSLVVESQGVNHSVSVHILTIDVEVCETAVVWGKLGESDNEK